ncbi:MAG: class I SAM-dependent methyltransferase [Thermodesulfobacteriota bacterium]|nr:class I SAM-dependent methyltransferase [Thermodesulfobacteriota bacterium]
MELDVIKEINSLWNRIFPYLAAQIKEFYRKNNGRVLELGAFSGGISIELAKLYPGTIITIAVESEELVKYINGLIENFYLTGQINVIQTSFSSLSINDNQFDLVICRGAFFYLDKEGWLLKKIFQFLKKGGVGIIGGGYGEKTPEDLIVEIKSRSKELNDMLGRQWFAREEIEEIILNARLKENCHIYERGGLWLVMNK